jgi:nitrate/nitrite-specific signal transduction histidine kinase
MDEGENEMALLCKDLLKISQALDKTYALLEKHQEETTGLESIEIAKHEWKQAFTYAMSDVFRA